MRSKVEGCGLRVAGCGPGFESPALQPLPTHRPRNPLRRLQREAADEDGQAAEERASSAVSRS